MYGVGATGLFNIERYVQVVFKLQYDFVYRKLVFQWRLNNDFI